MTICVNTNKGKSLSVWLYRKVDEVGCGVVVVVAGGCFIPHPSIGGVSEVFTFSRGSLEPAAGDIFRVKSA